MFSKRMLIQAAATVGIAAMTVTPAFAGNHGNAKSEAKFDARGGWKHDLRWWGWQAPLKAEQPKAVDPSCVKLALAKRDDAMIVALDARHVSHRNALVARKSAMQTAWSQSDLSVRVSGITEAIKSYRSSLSSANTTFRTTKKAAWTTYGTERKACGEGAPVEGGLNAGLDAEL